MDLDEPPSCSWQTGCAGPAASTNVRPRRGPPGRGAAGQRLRPAALGPSGPPDSWRSEAPARGGRGSPRHRDTVVGTSEDDPVARPIASHGATTPSRTTGPAARAPAETAGRRHRDFRAPLPDLPPRMCAHRTLHVGGRIGAALRGGPARRRRRSARPWRQGGRRGTSSASAAAPAARRRLGRGRPARPPGGSGRPEPWRRAAGPVVRRWRRIAHARGTRRRPGTRKGAPPLTCRRRVCALARAGRLGFRPRGRRQVREAPPEGQLPPGTRRGKIPGGHCVGPAPAPRSPPVGPGAASEGRA